jgi:signal transduction histidine kinase
MNSLLSPLLARARRCRLLLPLLLAAPSARAQGPVARPPRPVPMQLDSQQAWLRRLGPTDTLRVAMLTNVGGIYLRSDLDSARAYCLQAVALARRLGHHRGLDLALNNLASCYYYSDDLPAAQHTFEATLTAARRVGNYQMLGNAYLGLGNVAWDLRNEAASHRYYEQARLAYARARPRQMLGEVLVLHNRANNYLAREQPALALPLIRQAQALLAQPVTSQLGQSTLSVQSKARQEAKLLLLLAEVQQPQHPDSALATLRQALRQAQLAHEREPEAGALLHLAALNFGQRHYAAALTQARQAASLFRAIGDPAQLVEALRLQADALAALHLPGAYDTLQRAATLRDTLLTRERVEAVATAQARFDRAGQEARIAGLEKDRRIQTLEAQHRATRTRLLGTLGALAGSLLLGGVVLGYRRRQKAREAALRQRLAADLHDDLGPLLTQLAVETSLLREQPHSPAQLLARLQRLTDTSQQATRHLGDVLRELDQGPAAAAPAPVGELVQQLREQAHEALSPYELSLTFRLADPALAERLLTPATRHALSLIFREALHNVVKHAAGATLVEVTLAADKGGLALKLHDDGQQAPVAGRPGGRGLRNMQARAQALGGQCVAGPAPGGGYQVHAWLPA